MSTSLRPVRLVNPTHEALFDAVAEHPHGLLDAMEALPGSAFHREHDLTWYTTPIVSPMFAGVMRARLTGDVDADIDRVSSALQSSGVPFAFWWITPQSKPDDLGERLVAKGWLSWDLQAPGMAVEIGAIREDPRPLPPDFRIERVADASGLHDWSVTLAAGMEVPPFAGQAWEDATTQLGILDAPWRLFVGYLGDRPVAVAGSIGTAGVASVFAVATVPDARGRGIGGAITVAAIRSLQQDGYRWSALFSTELGEPVYRRLGFETLCTISRYLWRRTD